jgi:hypothetical protein
MLKCSGDKPVGDFDFRMIFKKMLFYKTQYKTFTNQQQKTTIQTKNQPSHLYPTEHIRT